MDVEERMARLERLVEGLVRQRTGASPPDAADDARSEHEEQRTGEDLGEFLNRHRAVGRRMVCAGVAHWEVGSQGTGTHVMIWDGGDRVSFDARKLATLCQALGSEPRLSMLCELIPGPRSTSDLTRATGLDRGQLYHHLRDLFVEGLVEQPERGRYRLTDRGETVVLLGAVLASAAPEAKEPFTLRPEDIRGDGGTGGAVTATANGGAR